MPVWFDPPGSAQQLIFGLLVSFMTFGVYTAFNPFVEERSNVFAQLCQVQIFFALLSSIALKFAQHESSEVMDYLLTVLTFVPIVISLVLRTPLKKLLEASERAKLSRKLLKMCCCMKQSPAQTADSGEVANDAIVPPAAAAVPAAEFLGVAAAAVPAAEFVGVASVPVEVVEPAPALGASIALPPGAVPVEQRAPPTCDSATASLHASDAIRAGEPRSSVDNLQARIKAMFSPKEAGSEAPAAAEPTAAAAALPGATAAASSVAPTQKYDA